MPRVDQPARRAASKRRSLLSEALRLTGEAQQEALRSLLASSSLQLAKAERTAADSEAAVSAARQRAEASDAELSKERATGEKLQALTVQLKERQQALLSERERLLATEEAERAELSDYFKSRIAEVNEGLNVQGTERVAQLNENERLHASLVSLAAEYDQREAEHTMLLAESAATVSAMETELEKIHESQLVLAAEEDELLEREKAYAASDQELKLVLEGYAEEFERVQVDIKETNERYAEHSALLSAATLRMREAERTHQARPSGPSA